MVLVVLRDNWVGCHRFTFIWLDDFIAATAYFDDCFDGACTLDRVLFIDESGSDGHQ
jgi:hypothetical protein